MGSAASAPIWQPALNIQTYLSQQANGLYMMNGVEVYAREDRANATWIGADGVDVVFARRGVGVSIVLLRALLGLGRVWTY
jgi:hypothetical protein